MAAGPRLAGGRKTPAATIGQNLPAPSPNSFEEPQELEPIVVPVGGKRGATHAIIESIIRTAVRALDPAPGGHAQLAGTRAAARGLECGRRLGVAAAAPELLARPFLRDRADDDANRARESLRVTKTSTNCKAWYL